MFTLRISKVTLLAATSAAIVGLVNLTSSSQGAEPAPKPQMQAVLDQLKALAPEPIETLTAEEARKQPTPGDAARALLVKKGKNTAPEPVASVQDITFPSAGGYLPARIYKPAGKGPFPVLLYFHGGGWVIANIDTYDATPRALANAAKAMVISAEYRHAPENKFPAAHDDALAAYRWVKTNAASLGGDPKRIAVGGESAGANLAANVAIGAQAAGLSEPIYQLLVYPVAGSDMNTPSYKENADAKPLNKAMMAWFFDKTLKSADDSKDPRIDLVNAPLPKRLAPATVITAQIDPLRSEGQAYAEKLRAAGVQVDYRNYDGVTHEFFGLGAVVSEARQAELYAASNLRRAFSSRH